MTESGVLLPAQEIQPRLLLLPKSNTHQGQELCQHQYSRQQQHAQPGGSQGSGEELILVHARVAV
jgi:hypothetical protein